MYGNGHTEEVVSELIDSSESVKEVSARIPRGRIVYMVLTKTQAHRVMKNTVKAWLAKA